MHRWWKATCIMGTSNCTKMNSSLIPFYDDDRKSTRHNQRRNNDNILLPMDKGDEREKYWSGNLRPSSTTNLSWDCGQNPDFLATGTQICKMKGWVRQSLRFFPSLKKIGILYKNIFNNIYFIYFWWWWVLVATCRIFVMARGLLLNCASWAQQLQHVGS